MRTCGACTAVNAVARRFCGQCAATLTWACGRCRFENEDADRFCGGCAAEHGLTVEPCRPVAPSRVTTPVATPAPTPSVAVHAAATDTLTLAELQSLITVTPAATAADLLPLQVTQDALDRLFGGGS